MILFVLGASAAHAQAPIDIKQFCNDATATDHTECIHKWIAAGRLEPERKLFASEGVYHYRVPASPYSRMRLECEGPQKTTFRSIKDVVLNRWPSALIQATTPVSNVRIDNCGFNLNGNETEYAAAIDISAEMPRPSTDIRVRGNRIFDGTHPGQMSALQRQYIVLLNCHDCRVENNHLSEGGRIKVGRPGRDLRISGNIVEHANDNAITVADLRDGVSQRIRIHNNQVLTPKEIGIYFGADGDTQGSPALTTRDVRVEWNRIEGDWKTACIFGRLPYNGSDVHVRNNSCVKTGAQVQGVTGIRIKRTCGAVAPATNVSIERNSLSTSLPAGSPAAYDHGGIAVSGIYSRMRVRNNGIRNAPNGTALVFRFVQITHASIEGNELNGGTFEIRGTIAGAVQTPTSTQPNSAPVPEACPSSPTRPGVGGLGTGQPPATGVRPGTGAGTPGGTGTPPKGTR